MELSSVTRTLEWDPLDQSSINNPYPIYRELREREPVYWHAGMQSWVLTRYDDCRLVLHDYTNFARDPRRVGVEVPDEKLNIQLQDPPEQALLRRLVGRSLNTQELQWICSVARTQMANRLHQLARSGPFDLMRDVAGPTAMYIINAVFGVDSFTASTYVHIYKNLTQAMDSGLDPDRLAPGQAAGRTLTEQVASWVESRPDSGILSALFEEEEAVQLPRKYVSNTMAATFNAGFSTLYASTGAVTMTLLREGSALAFESLQALGEAKLVLAAHELLRYTSPAQATSRSATTPTEFHGVPVKTGDTLVTVLASANRDPRQFPDPDRLIFDRAPNRHLAFASGPHLCLGARLAQIWIVELLKLLIECHPRLRLCGQEEFMNAATLRNLTSLPVEFSP